MKITIALVLLFTYGLQMTAPMKVVWDEVGPYVKEHPARYYYGLRAALIVGNGKFFILRSFNVTVVLHFFK